MSHASENGNPPESKSNEGGGAWESWLVPEFGEREQIFRSDEKKPRKKIDTKGKKPASNTGTKPTAGKSTTAAKTSSVKQAAANNTSKNPKQNVTTDEVTTDSEVEANSTDTPADESVEDVETQPYRLPSAEELAELRKGAELEGYNEGFSKGEQHGFESGEKKAHEECSAQLQHAIARAQGITEALQHPLAQQQSAIEAIITDTIVNLTRAVVARELQLDRSHIVELVQQSLSSLPFSADNVQIMVHPDDRDVLEKHAQAHGLEWQLKASVSIEPGGCQVMSRDSVVDCQVSERLTAAIDQFLGKHLAGEMPAAGELPPSENQVNSEGSSTDQTGTTSEHSLP
ncbi:FliH/SctL family protein [Marinibactrum halimedae]|uniref:Flagellar assembly protein FliH n=1 Tax=Marinibactrum halimedae TaxID=1444977 RepID=A0AA37TEV1_9GAMM|nr:FliH/SctL family protein [Marinibactrum halimedae]MCD9458850.1 hypothetical protein [Marinibactrum halimedae]GLS27702.1 hypothetical protein GCM10007877_34210 [Marinibactrum halimedae]